MFAQKAVLLGLAEVRIPLRHLEASDLCRISQVCYRKLLDLPATNDDETVKCIGVVDSFYALQEVELTVEDNVCKIWSKNDLILRHNLKNVLAAVHAEENSSRIIVLSKTENFGSAAIVLQLMDKKAVDRIIEQMIKVKRNSSTRKDNYFKRETGSFGKSVHKRLNNFLSSMSTHYEGDGTQLRLPRTVSAPMNPLELSEDDFTSEADDESSSPEEEPIYILGNSLKLEKPGSPLLKLNSLNPIEAEIQFLLESEKKYLDSLNNLLSIQKEIENTNFILEYPIGIFDNVDDLRNLHDELYSEFLSCKYSVNKICSIITANKDNLDAYIAFVSNIPVVEKILEINRQIIVAKFPSLLADLRKPRMRLNYYVLTLESLLKITTENEQRTINECILMLKDKLKEADTRLVIDSIHGVPFDLCQYGRVVISSELTLRRGSGLIRRRYQAILLENVLVLAKGTPGSSDYVMCFSLIHMQLVHQIRGLFIHLKLRAHEKSSILIFKAATIKLQQKWMTLLQPQIHTSNKQYFKMPLDENGVDDSRNNALKDADIPVISVTDYDNEKNNRIDRDDNSVSSTPAKVPPLSFWAAFSSVDHLLHLESLYSYEENLRAFVKSAREMKVKDALHELKNEKAKETVILLKEFYTKQLVPSVNLSTFDNEDILFKVLENSSEYFRNLVIKLSFYFSVQSYESYPQIPKVLLIAIKTVVYLRNAFICKKWESEGDNKNYESVEKIFSDALQISNNKLKRRYVSNMPSRLSMDVIHEGLLILYPNTKMSKNLYVFLTESGLFGFNMQDSSFLMEININLDDAIVRTSSEDLCFQIVIKNSNHTKEKYDFQCSTKIEKREWILALEGMSDNDGKALRRW